MKPNAKPSLTITLTGRVLEWDLMPSDEVVIEEHERDAYEIEGYLVAEIGDAVLAIREERPADGDVTILSRLDARGSMAAAGGHTNYGFSGYFTGYVYLRGERKRLVDFRKLFTSGENQFGAQYQKPEAENAVRSRIEALAGTTVTKVKGGFAFLPVAAVDAPA